MLPLHGARVQSLVRDLHVTRWKQTKQNKISLGQSIHLAEISKHYIPPTMGHLLHIYQNSLYHWHKEEESSLGRVVKEGAGRKGASEQRLPWGKGAGLRGCQREEHSKCKWHKAVWSDKGNTVGHKARRVEGARSYCLAGHYKDWL